MKKRILSILLLFCMVLTLLPTTAFAADESPAVTNVTVTFDSNGGGEVESQTIQQGQQVQRPADPIKDGHTFIGWYNKADLQYINLPEWNFDYPVFENMELAAQWMDCNTSICRSGISITLCSKTWSWWRNGWRQGRSPPIRSPIWTKTAISRSAPHTPC
ncbi:MAG: InlB B-repeat-containing protein [Firmicutes bacterium]|nr:InlB B-repeat-containing protein [Bacillota bacterium]